MELDVHLGSLTPTGESVGPEGSSWCGTVLAWGKSHLVSGAMPLTLLLKFLSVSVMQGCASASPLGSGIFTKVYCLWIAASWTSCERD